jgi:hypothetical protein
MLSGFRGFKSPVNFMHVACPHSNILCNSVNENSLYPHEKIIVIIKFSIDVSFTTKQLDIVRYMSLKINYAEK